MYLSNKPSSEDKLAQEQFAAMKAESVRKHYQRAETAVVIPALQSFLLGMGVTGVVISLMVWLKKNHSLEVGAVVFFIVFTAYLWFRLNDWRNLIWHIETALNVDITGDNVIGPPSEMRLNVVHDGGKQQQFLDLKGSEDSILELLDAILSGKPLTRREWVDNKKLFSRSDYDNNRDELLRAGVIEWVSDKDSNQGVKGTEEGKKAIQDALFTPSPTE